MLKKKKCIGTIELLQGEPKIISDDIDDDLDPRTIDRMLLQIEEDCKRKFGEKCVTSIIAKVKAGSKEFDCCRLTESQNKDNKRDQDKDNKEDQDEDNKEDQDEDNKRVQDKDNKRDKDKDNKRDQDKDNKRDQDKDNKRDQDEDNKRDQDEDNKRDQDKDNKKRQR